MRRPSPPLAPTRGILYPARLPTFRRVPAPTAVAELVRWFWIPEWDIEPGRTSRQHLIAYPACNLVVQPTQVTLSGPTTRAAHRDLTGRGWAVGALLRPAAVRSLVADPAELRDREQVVDAPELHRAVTAAMAADEPEAGHTGAVAAFTAWLARHLPTLSDRDRQANAMVEIIDGHPDLHTLADVAAQMKVSPRTLQRIALRYVGLPPAEMIRRRRLQEAAERVRADPATSLAQVAAELGYADQAHLTREFRDRLGFTPGDYRSQVGAPGAGHSAVAGAD